MDVRSQEIKASSYLYEFNMSRGSWGMDQGKPLFPDVVIGNSDDVVSWYEAKMTEVKGLVEDPAGDPDKDAIVDPKEKFGGHVPMVRCFWHAREGASNLSKESVLNLACGLKNVYECTAEGDGWKRVSH